MQKREQCQSKSNKKQSPKASFICEPPCESPLIYIGNEIGKCQSSARIVCGRLESELELDLGLKSAPLHHSTTCSSNSHQPPAGLQVRTAK